MSGLIDNIVRRRRASASSRLAPPAHVLEHLPWGETVNGHGPAVADGDPDPAVDGDAAQVIHPGSDPALNGAVNGSLPATIDGHELSGVVADEPAPLPAEPPEAADTATEPDTGPSEEPALTDEDEQPTSTFAAVEAETAEAAEAAAREVAPVVAPAEAPAAEAPAPEPPAPEAEAAPAPAPPEQLAYPSLRERIALRRRARYLAAVREVQLRDLGGFLLELHRFGRSRPDLVEAKLTATAATDSELRALHHRLDEEAPIAELRRPGIGGACEHCGAVFGSLDRFCASCGESLR